MQFCLCCLFTEYGFLVVNPLLFRMYIRTSPWEGIVRELGMDMWMLLYVKWITNKDLLFSTWSSAQCYMVAQMGGVWGRMDACVCMAGSLCSLPEAVTTLLIGHTPKENKKLKKKMNFTFDVIREGNLKPWQWFFPSRAWSLQVG